MSSPAPTPAPSASSCPDVSRVDRGARRAAVIPTHPHMRVSPMNDHHFSYPVVVPLQGVTISGHSSHPPAPAVSLQAIRPLQAIRLSSSPLSTPRPRLVPRRRRSHGDRREVPALTDRASFTTSGGRTRTGERRYARRPRVRVARRARRHRAAHRRRRKCRRSGRTTSLTCAISNAWGGRRWPGPRARATAPRRVALAGRPSAPARGAGS